MELLVLKSWDETLKTRATRAHKTTSAARYTDELNRTLHNTSGVASSFFDRYSATSGSTSKCVGGLSICRSLCFKLRPAAFSGELRAERTKRR